MASIYLPAKYILPSLYVIQMLTSVLGNDGAYYDIISDTFQDGGPNKPSASFDGELLDDSDIFYTDRSNDLMIPSRSTEGENYQKPRIIPIVGSTRAEGVNSDSIEELEAIASLFDLFKTLKAIDRAPFERDISYGAGDNVYAELQKRSKVRSNVFLDRFMSQISGVDKHKSNNDRDFHSWGG